MFELPTSPPFSPLQAAGLLLAQASVWLVCWRQNRPCAPGGPIAFTKALWMVFAITLWLTAPACLACNGWRQGQVWVALAFGLLALSMHARGVAELVMLRRGVWRVQHGLWHDRLQLWLAAVAGPMALLGGAGLGSLVLWLLTVTSLFSELRFVTWFAAATAGPGAGIYFVPGEPRHRALLRRCNVIFLPQYALFLGLLAWSLSVG